MQVNMCFFFLSFDFSHMMHTIDPAALSLFIPSVISRREPNTSFTIEITRAQAGAAKATGLVDIAWPKDSTAEMATLFLEVLAAGKTKKVHKVTSPFVNSDSSIHLALTNPFS
jgi:hypothetical protein